MMEENKVAARLYQLAQFFILGEPASDLRIAYLTSAEFEDVLDEVQGYVKSIDVAQELHYMGRLVHLLHHVLYYPHPGIRAKTAELVTTMVKNNPRSQKLVIEANGLQPLLYNFISDPDATSRIKALGAISALIQNNKPGITAFRLENGYVALKESIKRKGLYIGHIENSESDMLLHESMVLNLILHLLHENSSDNNTLVELGFHNFMIRLLDSDESDDAEVREAILRGLLVLAKDEEGRNNGQLVKNDDYLKRILRRRIEGIVAMAPEDLDVTREEIQLMDSLWNVCYNEPSSLRQKGLLVLPGEDVHAPDVASKLFEPPLRGAWAAAAEVADRNSVSEELDVARKLVEPPLRGAWAAAEAADRNFVSEKKEAPLLLNAWVQNDNKLNKVLEELKQFLHQRIQVPQEEQIGGVSAMNSDYLRATRVERRFVDSLWNACYNKGVHKLCGMYLEVPYVRCSAAAKRNSVCEKKEAPLLINVGVKNRTERTFFTSNESNQPRSRYPIFRTASVPNRSIRCCSSVLFGFAKCIRYGR